MARVNIFPDASTTVANLPSVGVAVSAAAHKLAARARARHALHYYEGHSRIYVERRTGTQFVNDYDVVLDDRSGQRAAWAIELETGSLRSAPGRVLRRDRATLRARKLSARRKYRRR